MENELLTAKQAAELLQISVKAIYAANYRGKLVASKSSSSYGIKLFDKSEILRYQQSRMGGLSRKKRCEDSRLT